MDIQVYPFDSCGGFADRFSNSDNSLMDVVLEGGNGWKQDQVHGVEDWGQFQGTDSLGSDYGFYEDDGFIFSKHLQQERQLQSILGYGLLDNLRFDVFSPPLEACRENIVEPSETSNGIQDVVTPKKENRYPQSLASLALLTSQVDVVPLLNNPFNLSFSGLSKEEIEDVELVDILLTAAGKVHCQEFELAIKLLSRCDQFSSINGNPVQRVAYYISVALQEKIDQELKGLRKDVSFDMEQIVMDAISASIAYRQKVPFCQVEQFAGIQAIIENVAEAKKVHIIDLGIKCKRLMGFAQTMNLPFSFRAVTISDTLDLKEDQFELDNEETPDRLDHFMGVIRNMNPCIMVVIEVEANINSTAFVSHFIEGLFYYSAYFDCFDACMERYDKNRINIEKLLNKGIRCVVVADGNEQRTRHVKIDVWRAFFSRFRMKEKDLSMSSLYQADLMAQFQHMHLSVAEKRLFIGQELRGHIWTSYLQQVVVCTLKGINFLIVMALIYRNYHWVMQAAL
ncbi:DELLA protein RGL2-like [Tripterygium wilfordii]|uniref:DELLA protein RGL2-like n=1 Tax=Tripterygium wilfordii TaxID=458696 RepID=UPI0018F83197|nr:DELLA protein RGL2-like [Tripterygium wilfordii]